MDLTEINKKPAYFNLCGKWLRTAGEKSPM